MPTRHVSIDELRVGMYVAKLDVTRFRSPLPQHAFLIQEQGQIDKLHFAGIQAVEIDPARGEDISGHVQRDGDDRDGCSSPGPPQFPPPAYPKSLAQLNEGYAHATRACERLEHAVSGIFSELTEKGMVNGQQIAEALPEIFAVTRSLESSTVLMALSQDRSGDTSLSQHALTTCTLALLLGQTFNFTPLELRELATAAMLHDIGLLQIPAPVVQRFYSTSTPLSKREQLQMEIHPRSAVLQLKRQGGFEDRVLEIIGEHHVLLDGSGYPQGPCGAFTSDRTRIVMITDRYDELITGFGGTSPLTPYLALQRLFQEAQEGQLDREILSRLIKLVGIYPLHSCVRLNTNEQAVVTHLNPEKVHQPTVTITHDPAGSGVATPVVVDLAKQDGQYPERVIEAVLDTTPNDRDTSSSSVVWA